jgi:hypothetical protein
LALSASWRLPFKAAQQKIDTNDFMGEGRVYGGGLYKMEPKELGQIAAEGIVEAMKERLVGAGMARELPFFG